MPLPAIIWGVAAVISSIAGLLFVTKPESVTTGIMGAIPIWAWVVGVLLLVILLKK